MKKIKIFYETVDKLNGTFDIKNEKKENIQDISPRSHDFRGNAYFTPNPIPLQYLLKHQCYTGRVEAPNPAYKQIVKSPKLSTEQKREYLQTKHLDIATLLDGIEGSGDNNNSFPTPPNDSIHRRL